MVDWRSYKVLHRFLCIIFFISHSYVSVSLHRVLLNILKSYRGQLSISALSQMTRWDGTEIYMLILKTYGA